MSALLQLSRVALVKAPAWGWREVRACLESRAGIGFGVIICVAVVTSR